MTLFGPVREGTIVQCDCGNRMALGRPRTAIAERATRVYRVFNWRLRCKCGEILILGLKEPLKREGYIPAVGWETWEA